MIDFNFITNFQLNNTLHLSRWISNTIVQESCKVDEVNYIFVDDKYLLDINVKYLKHNTLTDIISFDYSLGKLISGDIYISIERVSENAKTYNVSVEDELHRVIIHGVLHFCGYKDKTNDEKKMMRQKEDYYLSLRNF